MVEPALSLLKQVRNAWRAALWQLPGDNSRLEPPSVATKRGPPASYTQTGNSHADQRVLAGSLFPPPLLELKYSL